MVNKTVIYTDNRVDDELIQEVLDALKDYKIVEVAFDVVGRTKHKLLSLELSDKLPNYHFEIDDNYLCRITKLNKGRVE